MALGVMDEALRIAAKRESTPSEKPRAAAWAASVDLTNRVRHVLRESGFEADSVSESLDGEELQVVQHAMNGLREQMRRSLDELPAGPNRSKIAHLIELGAELHELSQELYQERLTARAELLARVRRALSRLHGLDCTAAVIQTAMKQMCAPGMFDRAMVFRMDRSQMVAEGAYFGGDSDWAATVLDFARRIPPDLKAMILESDIARRRSAGLVQDPQGNPRAFRPLVLATDTNAYIAAPIAPEGRVIGFLHADCYFSGRPLDAIDRELLWAFAEGLGYATANAALRERLREEGHELGRTLRHTQEVVEGLASAEAALAPSDRAGGPASTSSDLGARAVNAPAPLTARQAEVLQLLAEGATNGEIAERLVISEHTIKSHVKHILRQLGAANRTEAVAWYYQQLPPQSRQF
jgi:DNA-binding CsgD family transcriptional regulator